MSRSSGFERASDLGTSDPAPGGLKPHDRWPPPLILTHSVMTVGATDEQHASVNQRALVVRRVLTTTAGELPSSEGLVLSWSMPWADVSA